MIGILGLGHHSTIHYITRINTIYYEKNGGFSTCPFKLLNVNFDAINPFLPDQFEQLKPITRNSIFSLNQLSVSSLLIPNITLFETIDQLDLPEEIASKIIHPLHLLSKEIASKNEGHYLVLGTQYTMQKGYISSFILNSGGKVVAPSMVHMKQIDALRTRIYSNGVAPSDIAELTTIIDQYSGAIPVLSCTELSVLGTHIKGYSLIDLVELQIMRALQEV